MKTFHTCSPLKLVLFLSVLVLGRGAAFGAEGTDMVMKPERTVSPQRPEAVSDQMKVKPGLRPKMLMDGRTSRNSQERPKIWHGGAADVPSSSPMTFIGNRVPVHDQGIWFHGVLNEFEGRYGAGGNSAFRWDGEAWVGGDYNRFWLKTEGTVTPASRSSSRVSDGEQELLYSRALTPYFNVQGGVRLDLDSGPVREWGAVGVEGLVPYGFETAATFYFSNRGVAGKFEGFYDILLTNRLVLQPQVELNFYSAADPARGVGQGLSDIDTGLRLRYEIWRKFAPYVGVTYDGPLGQAQRLQNAEWRRHGRHGYRAGREPRFTFGIRNWF